jgi:hypothetical protein
VYGGGADLDCDDRVESGNSSLERLERDVLVREDTEFTVANTEGDTTRDVGFVGTEPCVARSVLQ